MTENNQSQNNKIIQDPPSKRKMLSWAQTLYNQNEMPVVDGQFNYLFDLSGDNLKDEVASVYFSATGKNLQLTEVDSIMKSFYDDPKDFEAEKKKEVLSQSVTNQTETSSTESLSVLESDGYHSGYESDKQNFNFKEEPQEEEYSKGVFFRELSFASDQISLIDVDLLTTNEKRTSKDVVNDLNDLMGYYGYVFTLNDKVIGDESITVQSRFGGQPQEVPLFTPERLASYADQPNYGDYQSRQVANLRVALQQGVPPTYERNINTLKNISEPEQLMRWVENLSLESSAKSTYLLEGLLKDYPALDQILKKQQADSELPFYARQYPKVPYHQQIAGRFQEQKALRGRQILALQDFSKSMKLAPSDYAEALQQAYNVQQDGIPVFEERINSVLSAQKNDIKENLVINSMRIGQMLKTDNKYRLIKNDQASLLMFEKLGLDNGDIPIDNIKIDGKAVSVNEAYDYITKLPNIRAIQSGDSTFDIQMENAGAYTDVLKDLSKLQDNNRSYYEEHEDKLFGKGVSQFTGVVGDIVKTGGIGYMEIFSNMGFMLYDGLLATGMSDKTARAIVYGDMGHRVNPGYQYILPKETIEELKRNTLPTYTTLYGEGNLQDNLTLGARDLASNLATISMYSLNPAAGLGNSFVSDYANDRYFFDEAYKEIKEKADQGAFLSDEEKAILATSNFHKRFTSLGKATKNAAINRMFTYRIFKGYATAVSEMERKGVQVSREMLRKYGLDFKRNYATQMANFLGVDRRVIMNQLPEELFIAASDYMVDAAYSGYKDFNFEEFSELMKQTGMATLATSMGMSKILKYGAQKRANKILDQKIAQDIYSKPVLDLQERLNSTRQQYEELSTEEGETIIGEQSDVIGTLELKQVLESQIADLEAEIDKFSSMKDEVLSKLEVRDKEMLLNLGYRKEAISKQIVAERKKPKATRNQMLVDRLFESLDDIDKQEISILNKVPNEMGYYYLPKDSKDKVRIDEQALKEVLAEVESEADSGSILGGLFQTQDIELSSSDPRVQERAREIYKREMTKAATEPARMIMRQNTESANLNLTDQQIKESMKPDIDPTEVPLDDPRVTEYLNFNKKPENREEFGQLIENASKLFYDMQPNVLYFTEAGSDFDNIRIAKRTMELDEEIQLLIEKIDEPVYPTDDAGDPIKGAFEYDEQGNMIPAESAQGRPRSEEEKKKLREEIASLINTRDKEILELNKQARQNILSKYKGKINPEAQKELDRLYELDADRVEKKSLLGQYLTEFSASMPEIVDIVKELYQHSETMSSFDTPFKDPKYNLGPEVELLPEVIDELRNYLEKARVDPINTWNRDVDQDLETLDKYEKDLEIYRKYLKDSDDAFLKYTKEAAVGSLTPDIERLNRERAKEGGYGKQMQNEMLALDLFSDLINFNEDYGIDRLPKEQQEVISSFLMKFTYPDFLNDFMSNTGELGNHQMGEIRNILESQKIINEIKALNAEGKIKLEGYGDWKALGAVLDALSRDFGSGFATLDMLQGYVRDEGKLKPFFDIVNTAIQKQSEAKQNINQKRNEAYREYTGLDNLDDKMGWMNNHSLTSILNLGAENIYSYYKELGITEDVNPDSRRNSYELYILDMLGRKVEGETQKDSEFARGRDLILQELSKRRQDYRDIKERNLTSDSPQKKKEQFYKDQYEVLQEIVEKLGLRKAKSYDEVVDLADPKNVKMSKRHAEAFNRRQSEERIRAYTNTFNQNPILFEEGTYTPNMLIRTNPDGTKSFVNSSEESTNTDQITGHLLPTSLVEDLGNDLRLNMDFYATNLWRTAQSVEMDNLSHQYFDLAEKVVKNQDFIDMFEESATTDVFLKRYKDAVTYENRMAIDQKSKVALDFDEINNYLNQPGGKKLMNTGYTMFASQVLTGLHQPLAQFYSATGSAFFRIKNREAQRYLLGRIGNFTFGMSKNVYNGGNAPVGDSAEKANSDTVNGLKSFFSVRNADKSNIYRQSKSGLRNALAANLAIDGNETKPAEYYIAALRLDNKVADKILKRIPLNSKLTYDRFIETLSNSLEKPLEFLLGRTDKAAGNAIFEAAYLDYRLSNGANLEGKKLADWWEAENQNPNREAIIHADMIVGKMMRQTDIVSEASYYKPDASMGVQMAMRTQYEFSKFVLNAKVEMGNMMRIMNDPNATFEMKEEAERVMKSRAIEILGYNSIKTLYGLTSLVGLSATSFLAGSEDDEEQYGGITEFIREDVLPIATDDLYEGFEKYGGKESGVTDLEGMLSDAPTVQQYELTREAYVKGYLDLEEAFKAMPGIRRDYENKFKLQNLRDPIKTTVEDFIFTMNPIMMPTIGDNLLAAGVNSIAKSAGADEKVLTEFLTNDFEDFLTGGSEETAELVLSNFSGIFGIAFEQFDQLKRAYKMANNLSIYNKERNQDDFLYAPNHVMEMQLIKATQLLYGIRVHAMTSPLPNAELDKLADKIERTIEQEFTAPRWRAPKNELSQTLMSVKESGVIPIISTLSFGKIMKDVPKAPTRIESYEGEKRLKRIIIRDQYDQSDQQ